jgi:hypothetical protein
MSSQPNFIRKKFGPLREKTLRNALAHRIVTEFPRIGGPRICQLCADMILEIIFKHMRPKDHLVHGQTLWMAVSVHDPPGRRQRIADTELVPVLLDLFTAEDAQRRIDRLPAPQRLLRKALRLCEQAYNQGGLLSNCDLAELLNTNDSQIAHVLAQHERATNTLVPRRATLHDVGTGLTHKRIICWKRYAERSTATSASTIASATVAFRASRPSKPLMPWGAAWLWSKSTWPSMTCWRKAVPERVAPAPELPSRSREDPARLGSNPSTGSAA